MARKRLEDLYIVGEEVQFDDGSGDEPVKVFVRKLNSIEQETAMKRANAARSSVSAALRNPESDEYLELWGEVQNMDRELLEHYLVDEERMNRTILVEAEIGAEERWAEDQYLDGLREAWEELEAKWLDDPEDPEASRVYDELLQFTNEVEAEVQAHVDNLLADLADRSDEALRQMVMERGIQSRANMAWVTCYREVELWLAVREEDKKTLYFDDLKDLHVLPDEIYSRLAGVFGRISVNPIEGKGSRAKDVSSTSSE